VFHDFEEVDRLMKKFKVSDMDRVQEVVNLVLRRASTTGPNEKLTSVFRGSMASEIEKEIRMERATT